MPTIPEALQRAKAYHRAGQLPQAEQLYREILQTDPGNGDAHYFLGAACQALGKLDEAIAHLQRAVQLRPEHVPAHNHLGVVLAQQGKLDEAITSFRQALRLNPDFAEAAGNLQKALASHSARAATNSAAETHEPQSPMVEQYDALGQTLLRQGRFDEAVEHFQEVLQRNPDSTPDHYSLGQALKEQGKFAEAVACYRRALELAPQFAQGHNSLGIALVHQGDLPAAVASFREAVRLKPDFAHAYTNLGNAMREQGRLEEAVPCYREAVRLKPDFAEAHNNLGTALQDQGKLDEAMACYRRALELKPSHAEAHCNLGSALHDQAKLNEAMPCYRRALEVKPDLVSALDGLGKALQQQGRLDEAKACYQRAIQHDPDPLVYELRIATMCPTVFQSNDEIDQYRDRLLSELKRLAGCNLRVDLSKASTAGCEPPFNLQFHGRNDRELKEAYAQIFRRSFPQETPPARTGRPRIGFVVTRKHEPLFLRSLHSVLERLNPNLFEVAVVCSAASAANIRRSIRSDRVGMLPMPDRFDQMVSITRDARFDLLYYWEVGTDTTNYLLPFFRLAPVQCTSWGIQVTSGIPQMDYYISSVPVEPEDAADHYTEKLILANTLLSCQERVSLPPSPKKREDFGLRGDQHVYLCAQQLGKFHPDFDPILAAILRQDAQGVIAVTEDRHGGHIAGQLRRRLAATIPDVADRVVFLPNQPTPNYLGLVAAADVLLDPVHFGGVNSTYDGFSLNKPIVTWPSQFQRGRYTLACYQKMGITACVASDAQHYVDIAIRLGTDVDFRMHIVDQIRQASPLLFEDPAVVREHERILQALVERSRSA